MLLKRHMHVSELNSCKHLRKCITFKKPLFFSSVKVEGYSIGFISIIRITKGGINAPKVHLKQIQIKSFKPLWEA